LLVTDFVDEEPIPHVLAIEFFTNKPKVNAARAFFYVCVNARTQDDDFRRAQLHEADVENTTLLRRTYVCGDTRVLVLLYSRCRCLWIPLSCVPASACHRIYDARMSPVLVLFSAHVVVSCGILPRFSWLVRVLLRLSLCQILTVIAQKKNTKKHKTIANMRT
jgi:hypothetical protein